MNVKYSILLENHPKSFYHVWLLVQSLLQNAKVSSESIFVQYSEAVPEIWLQKLATLNIQLNPISIEKEESYAFKAKQLETEGLQTADFVILLDANTLLLDSIESVFDKNAVVGKMVDLPNPDIQVLKSVFKAAGFSKISGTKPSDLANDQITFDSNLSGGLYVFPKKMLGKIALAWKKWAIWFSKNKTIADLINNTNQISQVALSLALQETELPINHLPRTYNCPTHLHFSEDTIPVVLHHFNQFTKLGMLYNHNPQFPQFTEGLNRANQFISTVFDNLPFWEFRYRFYPELGAGIGSREEAKDYKIALLERLNISADESILDVGCGDLSVLENLELTNYLGVDCAQEAIKICREKRPDLNFQMLNAAAAEPTKQYDTVLCLEVLNHQNNRVEYENIINFLIKSTKKRLIVSGYNNKQPHHDSNPMVAFHEPLAKSLVDLAIFSNIRMVGKYSDVQVLLAEMPEPNDLVEMATKSPKKKKKLFGIFDF